MIHLLRKIMSEENTELSHSLETLILFLLIRRMPKRTQAIKVTDIRGEKPWLKRAGILPYAVETRDKQRTFLIVCEGQTEQLYFKSFPVVTATVKPVPLGCSKQTLVDCVKEIVDNEQFDEVWCVFDMDFKPGVNGQFQEFDNAIKSAVNSGFFCAYSNDAFELWFALHYHYYDQQNHRTFYFERLSEFWNVNYETEGKKYAYASKIYEKLLKDGASQKDAIARARSLVQLHIGKAPHNMNPVTMVFELVEKLNAHLRG